MGEEPQGSRSLKHWWSQGMKEGLCGHGRKSQRSAEPSLDLRSLDEDPTYDFEVFTNSSSLGSFFSLSLCCGKTRWQRG